MKTLRWYDHLSINLFWLGLNIRNNAISTIFMPYLVDMFARPEIKNTALGEMRVAGLLIAMLVQPAIGLLSDRSTSRFGRRRPFIFVGVLLDLLFLAFIALSWNYVSLLVAILLIQFSNNVSHGALQGLIPDLVPENQRGMSSAVKAIFELLPLVLLGFTIARLVGLGLFTWAVIATGGSLLVIMLLTMILVKEEPLAQKPDIPLAPDMLRVLGILGGIALGALAGLVSGLLVGGLGLIITLPFAGMATAKAVGVAVGGSLAMMVTVAAGVWAGAGFTLGIATVRRQSSFTWWVVNRLLYFAAITSIQSFAPYFLMYTFNVSREIGASMTGNLITVVGLFTLASAVPSGWLSDRFGARRLVGISGVLGAVGAFLLLGCIWNPALVMIYVAGGFIGLSAGLFTTANWALGTGLVPTNEAGRYLGISNLAGAGAGIVGSGIGGPIADFLNQYLPGLGYFVIFAAYGLLFLLSTISLRGVHPVEKQPAQVNAG